MEKKRKSNPDHLTKRPFKKRNDENRDKKHSNPEVPQNETGSPIQKMPITSNPHQEEILD